MARPRAATPVFTVAHGSDGVAHFGPAVGRAVAAALLASGVDVGAGGEVTVQGRIEELGDDRVRLVATVRGHTLAAEGPIDAIDVVADELASRLAPMLGGRTKEIAEASATKDQKETAPRKEASLAHVQRTAAPAVHPAPVIAESTTPPPASTAPAPAATPKEAPATSKETPAAPAPSASSTTAPSPAAATSPAAPAPASVPAPPATGSSDTKPPTVAVRSARSDDEDETPSRPAPYPYGYVRGRVVAHAIPDIPSAFAGTGASATQAFYYFLRRRLNLQVVPAGYGLAPPSIAADEGWRAGARAIVMARLHGIEYRPAAMGQSIVLRIEVMVVRDGRLVLRRLLQSAATDVGPLGLRRTRSLDDPIFQAVMQSLESVVSELAVALADIR